MIIHVRGHRQREVERQADDGTRARKARASAALSSRIRSSSRAVTIPAGRAPRIVSAMAAIAPTTASSPTGQHSSIIQSIATHTPHPQV
jgi:hypothetical protein